MDIMASGWIYIYIKQVSDGYPPVNIQKIVDTKHVFASKSLN